MCLESQEEIVQWSYVCEQAIRITLIHSNIMISMEHQSYLDHLTAPPKSPLLLSLHLSQDVHRVIEDIIYENDDKWMIKGIPGECAIELRCSHLIMKYFTLEDLALHQKYQSPYFTFVFIGINFHSLVRYVRDIITKHHKMLVIDNVWNILSDYISLFDLCL